MTTRMIASAGSVALQPFPREHYPMLWGWLLEFPENNFDDAGLKNLEDFTRLMDRDRELGREIFEVTHDRIPVGAISIRKSKETARFNGICLTREVHGRGIAAAAVGQILDNLFREGIRSVTATYFSDNVAVRKMFQKLGAVDVEEIQNATMRAGKPVSATTVRLSAGGLTQEAA